MAKRSKRKRQSVEWEVIRLTTSPARFIGTVRAPDEETAREIAIEQYQIRPQQQRSLLIRKN
jgi:1,2-phenylacetyl-CoA epoxidase PaaB subunit